MALLGLDDSLRLEMAVPDGFPLVLADPGLLERVLANLFSNALRYSPARRPPELHASLDGLSEEDLERFRERAVPEPAAVVRDPVRLEKDSRRGVPSTIIAC